MAEKVIIGCRLPNGIVIEHPKKPSVKAELAGRNKSLIVGGDHALTEVDSDLWAAWVSANKNFPALKSGAIFMAATVNDAKSIAQEMANEKTGLEPMSQSGDDPRAKGVKKAVEE